MTNERVKLTKDFEDALGYCKQTIKESKWNFDNQIDLFSAGLTARALETGHTMICVTEDSPDNTLYILLRHLFETAVRLRYLNLNPNSNINVFVLGSHRSALKGIGRKPKEGESDDVSTARAKHLEEERRLEKKLLKLCGMRKARK